MRRERTSSNLAREKEPETADTSSLLDVLGAEMLKDHTNDLWESSF